MEGIEFSLSANISQNSFSSDVRHKRVKSLYVAPLFNQPICCATLYYIIVRENGNDCHNKNDGGTKKIS